MSSNDPWAKHKAREAESAPAEPAQAADPCLRQRFLKVLSLKVLGLKVPHKIRLRKKPLRRTLQIRNSPGRRCLSPGRSALSLPGFGKAKTNNPRQSNPRPSNPGPDKPELTNRAQNSQRHPDRYRSVISSTRLPARNAISHLKLQGATGAALTATATTPPSRAM